jgi:hypothetical protein
MSEREAAILHAMEKANVAGLPVAIINGSPIAYTRASGFRDKAAGIPFDEVRGELLALEIVIGGSGAGSWVLSSLNGGEAVIAGIGCSMGGTIRVKTSDGEWPGRGWAPSSRARNGGHPRSEPETLPGDGRPVDLRGGDRGRGGALSHESRSKPCSRMGGRTGHHVARLRRKHPLLGT